MPVQMFQERPTNIPASTAHQLDPAPNPAEKGAECIPAVVNRLMDQRLRNPPSFRSLIEILAERALWRVLE